MSLARENKSEVIREYCLQKGDTGSSCVQCAIFSGRIRHLTEHLNTHKKDFHCRRGLLVLVYRRRNGLQYIKKIYGDDQHLALIKSLGIRDIFH